MKVLRRIAAAALVSSAVLGGCGYWGYGLTAGFLKLSAERRRAEHGVRALERLVALVRDAESGQRGYLLTGDPQYLDPYTAAVARAGGSIAAVRASPEFAPAEAAAVEALARAKLAELARTVALARAGDREAALAVVRGGEGRAVMTRVRTLAGSMVARADAAVAAKEQKMEASASRALLVIPAATALVPLVAFGSVASAYLHYRESVRRSARSEAEADAAVLRAQAEADAAVLRAEVEAGLARLEASRNADLLNALSHDLKTPLNAIGLNVQLAEALLGAAADPGVVLDALADVRRSIASQADILDGFLEVGRAERSAVAPERFRLAAVLDDVAHVVRPLAAAKGLAVAVECRDGDWAVTDRRKLKQVALNLAGNAVKFTHAGSVRLRGWRDGGGVRVAVTDTGPGVPAALMPRLFSDFAQGANPARDPHKGFGLGLAISKRLAVQVGGRIAVETGPGGSTFTVTVPDLELPGGKI